MKRIKNIVWVILNLSLLSGFIFMTMLINPENDLGKYSRPGRIVSKNITSYDHKSVHYAEHYLTVRWMDRDMENETVKVGGDTYATHEVNDVIFFNRLVSDLSVIDRHSGWIGLMWLTLALLWLVSSLVRWGTIFNLLN